MLVLLVIFMITAPLLSSSVNVDLPKASASPITPEKDPITVSVASDGKVYLGNDGMELGDVVARLQTASQANADRRIFVRGDKSVPYGRMIEVMVHHPAGRLQQGLAAGGADGRRTGQRRPRHGAARAASAVRQAVRVIRRTPLSSGIWFSLTLHLVLLFWLLISPTQSPTSASEPLPVDFAVADAEPIAPPDAIAASAAPGQQDPAPTPIPDPAPEIPPPSPPPQAETAPPPPAPTPAPDVPPPPPPVQQAETPPLPPAPTPPPVTPSHPPLAPPQRPPPRPAPPQRAAARPPASRAPANPEGVPAHATAGQDAATRASAANNGAAWMGKLKQWWDQRSFYPKEASQTDQDGTVRLRILIAADGQVTIRRCGAGLGIERARRGSARGVPQRPSATVPTGHAAQPADVVVTLHYHLADGGG